MSELQQLLLAVAIVIALVVACVLYVKKASNSLGKMFDDSLHWENLCNVLLNKYRAMTSEDKVKLSDLFETVLKVLHKYKSSVFSNYDIKFSEDSILLKNKEENIVFSRKEDSSIVIKLQSENEDGAITDEMIIDNLDKILNKAKKDK